MKKIIYFVIIMFISVSSYALREGIEKHIEGNKWLACELERNGMYLRTYYHLFAPNGDFVPLDYPESDMKYYKLNVETGEYERVENIKAEYILYGTVDPVTLRRFYTNCDRFGDCDDVSVIDLKTHKAIGKLDCGGEYEVEFVYVDDKIGKVFLHCYTPRKEKEIAFDTKTLKKVWESETWLDACRETYEGKEEGTLYCKSSKGNKMLKVRVDYDKGKWEVVKELDVPMVGQIKNGVGMHAEEELVDEDGKVYNSYQEIRDKLWDPATGTYKKSVSRKFTVFLYDMETGALIKKVSYPEKIIYPDSVGVRLMPDGNRFYGIYGRSERWKKEKVNGKGTKFKWVKISGERWEKLWVVDIEKGINKIFDDFVIGEEIVKKEPKVVHLCSDSSCVVYRAGDELIRIDLDKGKITKRIKIKYPEECRK